MHLRFAAALIFTALLSSAPALAEECPGNPDAIGTARTIEVDPFKLKRIGLMDYAETVPLERGEVILTFDDGPYPPMTISVLDTLKAECVKATFFLIGRNVRRDPELVRREVREGHTIANHSQNHYVRFKHLSYARGLYEIEETERTITAALNGEGKLAPFFRFPGLSRNENFERYLEGRGIIAMSADFMAGDWIRRLKPEQVLERALTRLEAKGSGILLLHDVHPRSALMLPQLLRELKARGYRIVHMVPAADLTPPATPVAEQPSFLPGRRVAKVTRRKFRTHVAHRTRTPNGTWPRTLYEQHRMP